MPMDDCENVKAPAALAVIRSESNSVGFSMASDERTGCLLRTLAAAKPGGAFLELGTGTGISAAWILDGMDARSRLLSIESDERYMEIARRHLASDRRLTLQLSNGTDAIANLTGAQFDFIFADTWPGKYEHRDETIALLRPGGFYVIDDMLPHRNWPDGHQAKVERLVAALEANQGLSMCKFTWASGIIVAVKRN